MTRSLQREILPYDEIPYDELKWMKYFNRKFYGPFRAVNSAEERHRDHWFKLNIFRQIIARSIKLNYRDINFIYYKNEKI